MNICMVSSATVLLFWVGVLTIPIFVLILLYVVINRHNGAEIPTAVSRGLIFIFIVGLFSGIIGLILHYGFQIAC